LESFFAPFGFTLDRTIINLFSKSNQNGAPNDKARAVTNQPIAFFDQNPEWPQGFLNEAAFASISDCQPKGTGKV
jgi:hypothetical protein